MTVGVVPVVSEKTTDLHFEFHGGTYDSLALLKRLPPVSSANKHPVDLATVITMNAGRRAAKPLRTAPTGDCVVEARYQGVPEWLRP
jgi:hypothetical protein